MLEASIVALPQDDRWSTLARAALREDVHAVHGELTAAVLQAGDEPADELSSKQIAEALMNSVNTNGGGLSCTHPGMYGIFTVIEAVRQLRGEAGARQVAGVQTALAHGNGGTLSSQSTAILGTAEAL